MARTVLARSWALIPVRQDLWSTGTVYGVWCGPCTCVRPSVPRWSPTAATSGKMGMHTCPRPCVIMNAIISGVTLSAAAIKSPSFSRSWSSTTIITRPSLSSLKCVVDLREFVMHGRVPELENTRASVVRRVSRCSKPPSAFQTIIIYNAARPAASDVLAQLRSRACCLSIAPVGSIVHGAGGIRGLRWRRYDGMNNGASDSGRLRYNAAVVGLHRFGGDGDRPHQGDAPRRDCAPLTRSAPATHSPRRALLLEGETGVTVYDSNPSSLSSKVTWWYWL